MDSMPDLARPIYIDIASASKCFPCDPHASAIWRWCRKGIRGRNGSRIVLKHHRSGGKLYTTAEWCAEFLAAIAAADSEYFSEEPGGGGPPGGLISQCGEPAPAAGRQRSASERGAAIRRAETEVASW